MLLNARTHMLILRPEEKSIYYLFEEMRKNGGSGAENTGGKREKNDYRLGKENISCEIYLPLKFLFVEIMIDVLLQHDFTLSLSGVCQTMSAAYS